MLENKLIGLEKLLSLSDDDGDWQTPLMSELRNSNHQSRRPEVQQLIEQLLEMLNARDECIFSDVYSAELPHETALDIFEQRLNGGHRDFKGLVSMTGRTVMVILKERGNKETANRRMEKRFADAIEYADIKFSATF